jgi:cold shock CspA family protein
MATKIGTVGYLDIETGRGVIHPDAEYLSDGINILVTPEGLDESGIRETLRSSHRVTFDVSQGSGGVHAVDIKPYGGQGVAG